MDYVRGVRLRHGAHLVRLGGVSVDGIAARVGYASRSQFPRAFHERFGCAPRDFRREHG